MSRIGLLEACLVLSLMLFGFFAFVVNASMHFTAFYGVPPTGGVVSSPDKLEVSSVPSGYVFSPTRVPANVSVEDQQRALALLSAVLPAPSASSALSPSGVVPFAMSVSGSGDSVVDPYSDVSITFLGDDGIPTFVSYVGVPISGFGDRQVFSLSSQFSYRGYLFVPVLIDDDRVLFRVSGPSSYVFLVCLQGFPNVYYDSDTGVYLKVLVRGNSVYVWSRGSKGGVWS